MKDGEVYYKAEWLLSKRYEQARFRVDPVPFVHKRKRSFFKCWYKTPQTRNERRQVSGNEKYIRGRRNFINLPQSWNDNLRADAYDKRSWKKNSIFSKQWMKRIKL